MKTSKRRYDRTGGPEVFKRMAVELSLAKDLLKTTAKELGNALQILTQWRRERPSIQKANASARVGTRQEQ